MKQTQSIQAEPAESVHLEHGLLRLYVAGQSPKCLASLANLRRLCAVELQGRFEIEVVDLLENPRLARGDQIVAVPDPGPEAAAAGQEDHWRPVRLGTRSGWA